ncbi:sensor domain-containing protein [Mycobacterium sp. CVI_P3]|uniref:Sensor domain-containing protein n=1 Tax=Mycobacterium pinniadriaticum TaxID=2994102 RepID=A0ABT3SLH9_9MYCO|nr:sensor domain-containing protein [Mycobacterium pinniadriaticum]MCX2933957.1 sensor domain-containing protein [Mycobacterium pinniadriaticum]MCX2940379.1 sensor domain-containing protein [Mycobacterium pinniadriaticum]
MTVRAGLACCAAAALLTGCTQWVEGSPLRAASEPPYRPPGIVDVDQVLLTQAQMRAITGGGQDLTIIPSMDGKYQVDIEPLAESVPRDCRFVFAETDTFGSDVADFHKTSFQYPARGALISEAAAAYRDDAAARQAFNMLSTAVHRCADGSMGSYLVGEVDGDTDSLRTRPGRCGRDYRLKSSVLVEVTFCAFPESVPEIVMTNIVNKIPGG